MTAARVREVAAVAVRAMREAAEAIRSVKALPEAKVAATHSLVSGLAPHRRPAKVHETAGFVGVQRRAMKVAAASIRHARPALKSSAARFVAARQPMHGATRQAGTKALALR